MNKSTQRTKIVSLYRSLVHQNKLSQAIRLLSVISQRYGQSPSFCNFVNFERSRLSKKIQENGLPHIDPLSPKYYTNTELKSKSNPTKWVKRIREGADHDWYINRELEDLLADAWHNKSRYRLPPSIRRILVIGHDLDMSTGVHRPISHVLNFLHHYGGYTLTTIEFDPNMELQSVSLQLHSSDLIIVNSISQLASVANLRKAISKISKSKPVFAYFHETDWTLSRIDKVGTERLRQAMPHLHVLLCSHKQKQAFLNICQHGEPLSWTVVRNTSFLRSNSEPFGIYASSGRRTDKVKILMSGLVQERKGTTFYSKCADYAIENGKNMMFYWAGHLHDPDQYISPNVEFLGKLSQSDLFAELESADIFFLSSYDDPFPLAAIEALSLGCKLLLPRATGITEMLDGSQGVVIYEEHDVKHAVEALEMLSRENLSTREVVRTTNSLALRNFCQRFLASICKVYDNPVYSRAQHIASSLYSSNLTQLRICAVVHLYYLDLLYEFRQQLQSLINFHVDLFVTVPETTDSYDCDYIKSIFAGLTGDVHIFRVPNRGLDVGAFFFVMSEVIRNGKTYDLILKIHGKKSLIASGLDVGTNWRKELVGQLLGTCDNACQILGLFHQDPSAIILAPSNYIINKSTKDLAGNGNAALVNKLVAQYGLTQADLAFVRGTMFWARYKPMINSLTVDRDLPSISDFAEGYVVDESLAHAYERLLSYLPQHEHPIIRYKQYEVNTSQSISRYRNKHAGSDIYILCSGPSLGLVPKSFFDKKLTIGINSVITEYQCSYAVFKEYTSPDLEYAAVTSCNAIFVSLYKSGNRKQGVTVCNKKCFRTPEVVYFDHDENTRDVFSEEPLSCSSDSKLVVSWSTITSAINLAAYMGASNIILIGHDCGVLNGASNIPSYSRRTDGSVDAWGDQNSEYVKWLSLIEAQTLKVRDYYRVHGGPVILSLNPFINLGLEGNIYAKG